MEITCEKCQHNLKLPDDKIPEGRSATVRCPKCKNKITVRKEKEQEDFEFEADESVIEADDTKTAEFPFDDDYSDEYDKPERMFEFIEDEGKTALICEVDKSVKDKVKPVLDFMEYHIVEADTARETIKRLRYNFFNVIIINEEFDTRDPDENGVLIYLSRMMMLERRKMFVGLLTRRFQTLDHMTALHKSVNMTINLENLDQFEKILKHGLSNHDIFYRLYMENLKNTGRV
jgi:predicted Zn finger-like uncharacterized protein